MKNREIINLMNNEQLSGFFCAVFMESVAKKADRFVCDICPVDEMCTKGKNGFHSLLERESDGATIKIQGLQEI